MTETGGKFKEKKTPHIGVWCSAQRKVCDKICHFKTEAWWVRSSK
jgi:hypothetical protein